MRIEARAYGIAAPMTAALVTTFCAAVAALAPTSAIAFFGTVIHMDLVGMTARVSWAGYFTGLLFWSLFFGLLFGFAAWTYDRLIAGARSGSAIAHG